MENQSLVIFRPFYSLRSRTGKSKSKHLGLKLLVILVALGGLLLWYEFRISALQSWFLTQYAEKLSYKIDDGPSEAIVFPSAGPFNVSRGYTRIPDFRDRLLNEGFVIAQQARFSDRLLELTRFGVTPPYREAPIVGLEITDHSGGVIYDTTRGRMIFDSYKDIPPLIIKSLTFIEDRELINPEASQSNPVVNWARFYKAALLYGIGKLGFPVHVEGGSTLATQLEKYRYSAGGRTGSVTDKLKQITGASLKVYVEGADTREARQEIILDYLNTVPLAGAPGYGEIYGLAKGLQVWFGLDLGDVSRILMAQNQDQTTAETYKKVLLLLAAVKAPSFYLVRDFEALEQRVNSYVRLMARQGVLPSAFARLVLSAHVGLMPTTFRPSLLAYTTRKAINTVRSNLAGTLGVPQYYDLDRLNMQVESTLDSGLQEKIGKFLYQMKDPDFVRKNGFVAPRMLESGDPARVVYSFVLYESTPYGNEMRVHADSHEQPFDINSDMKLDLGSTAKLRTLVHYLDVVYSLYQDYSGLSANELKALSREKPDPISFWALDTLLRSPKQSIEQFLDAALDRTYSGNPGEQFFTGGGIHTFANFSKEDNGRRLTVSQATIRSTNLVYIRLMRDLVRFHTARLPYDSQALLQDRNHPLRRQFLLDSVHHEAKLFLAKYYRKYRGLSEHEIVSRLLNTKTRSVNRLALLFFAWHPDGYEYDLLKWLEPFGERPDPNQLAKLLDKYKRSEYTPADYAYLLRKHPLEIWAAEKMAREPEISLADLIADGLPVSEQSYAWLFRTKRNSAAQKRHLRIKIERDAFARMTKYWKKLGYPFEQLVPSYATAIGSSSDRPAALAELMSILVNNGVRQPEVIIRRMEMGKATPYQTDFRRIELPGERILAPIVAKKARALLALVVEQGTARRVSGVYKYSDGAPIPVGGKTGSGDNRVKRFGRGGALISSTAVNRTATFVFYLGDRYFGALTAFVDGKEAGQYSFTSSLPVSMLSKMAPLINPELKRPADPGLQELAYY
ncbi:MAG: transglycosylase domain-containing protein [Gammaproteobacteria bacterium]